MIRAWLAAVVSLCVLVLVACVGQAAPCTPGDLVMATHAAECRARVASCGADADCRNVIYDDCDAWGEARCGLADAGAP